MSDASDSIPGTGPESAEGAARSSASPSSSAASASSGASTAVALLIAGTFFMEVLDGSIITPAIPEIAAGFGVPPVDLNLAVSVYLMTVGVLIPASGWVAERFGPRRVFALAVIVFTVASGLCGLAQTLPTFLGARILQGIGGAMMVPVGRLMVLRATPKDELIHAIAWLTWPALLAPVLGPPLGGLISDQLSWHWIFWINLPLGAVALFLIFRILPNPPPKEMDPFDGTGFVLVGLSVGALLFAAESMGQPHVNAVETAVVAAVGAGLAALAVRHLRRARAPMLRVDAMRIPTFSATVYGGAFFRMGVSAVPFLVPLMMQRAFHQSAFRAGLIVMAIFIGNVSIKPFTTPILRRFGFRTVLVVNGFLNAAAIGACATFTLDTPLLAIAALLLVGGMTRSMQFTALNTLAFADVEAERMPDANTVFSTATQLSRGVGIALGAIGWRLGDFLAPDEAQLLPFRIAFVVVAAVALLSVIDCWRLRPDSGAVVSRRKIAA